MFLKINKVAAMARDAYKKGGLRVASDNDFLTMQGRGWAMQILNSRIPKELLGEIVKLTGEIPQPESQILAMESGNQEEIFYRPGDYLDVYRNAMSAEAAGRELELTRVVLASKGRTLYSVFQEYDEANYNMHVMPEEMRARIDAGYCEKDEELYPAYVGLGNSYYRRSDHMAIAITLYTPEEFEKGVEFLHGRDLIGIME